ncbi:MAG TPA: radical SAM protein [Acidobacteriota bacterium]|nr:radical SAM protein [Acidobacteriota bacterium]
MAIECLSLIITAQCNLHCSYCYQNAKNAHRAGWDVVRAGIDLVFGEGLSQVELMFLGGEPLLEFNLLRRAVSYAEALDRGGKHFRFSLSTNGTLVSETVADYLDEHKFDVQLSFDGVQEAQLYRGRGTFEILDRLLDSFRAEHAELFRNRLRIALTVVPETISFLSNSIQYLLEKDVREIFISSCTTPYPGWQADKIHELDEVFARIAELSRNHVEKTGSIPVVWLRKATDEIPQMGTGISICSGLNGKTLAMDLDGQLYTCPMFVESYQKFPSGSLMEQQLSKLKLGNVRDPEVHNRRAALAESARMENVWICPEGCSSSYGNCDECEYYGRCSVCPVSVWQASSASGPRRIPDFICAFNKVALKYRDRFPCVTDAVKKFLPEPDASDPIRRLEEYLRTRRSR